MVPQNVTGFFILAGLSDVPFVYNVKVIRDGRSYCTRIVNVTQAEGKGICFTCTCSFKIPEDSNFDVQHSVDLYQRYSKVLAGTRPEDWEEAPGMDVPWYWQQRRETGFNEPFPGLESRKVDMRPYNEHLSPFDRRQLIFYRLIGDLPPDPNMHACAHLYASDRNSLFIVANHLDMGEYYTSMASLSHTVVFHTPVKDVLMQRAGEKLWMCKEDWTSRAGGGRGMHLSRMWAPDGTHVASSWQEGMVRIAKTKEAEQQARVTMARVKL